MIRYVLQDSWVYCAPALPPRVSRLQAKIRWENGTWVLEDAESLNGMVYQGERVERVLLRDGDRVSLAPKVVLEYKETSA